MSEPETQTADCEPHTSCPDGYVARFEWAEKMSKTHRQRQCKGCGLWAIWEDQRGAKAHP